MATLPQQSPNLVSLRPSRPSSSTDGAAVVEGDVEGAEAAGGIEAIASPALVDASDLEALAA